MYQDMNKLHSITGYRSQINEDGSLLPIARNHSVTDRESTSDVHMHRVLECRLSKVLHGRPGKYYNRKPSLIRKPVKVSPSINA